MPDEINIEVVDPGSEDDPFTKPSDTASGPASATVSDSGQVAGEDEDDDGEADADDVDDSGDADDGDAEDDEELTPEEVTALQELQTYLEEQSMARFEREIIPKLQSTYDRQIAAREKQLQDLQALQARREGELLAQVREAQLNGLPEEERARLREQWTVEDRLAQLDARERELTGYHNEILKAELVKDYAQFGLEVEDLDEFETPEDMEAFAKEVELEYYRLMAANGAATGNVAEDEEETPRARVKSQTKGKTVPAGARAPSDAGGGTNVPEASKFNSNKGTSAMAENIKNLGWDSVKISS